jgi:hypothetical protein
MDIFFSDPSEIPLPPAEIRIRALLARPGSGNTRLRVALEIDPFQKRPNIDLAVIDGNGHEIATTSIIECQSRKMEITMHFRQQPASGPYRLISTLYYVEIEQPEFGEGVIDRQVVDTHQVDLILE